MKGLSAYQSFFQDGVGILPFLGAGCFRLWESIGDFQLPIPNTKSFSQPPLPPTFRGQTLLTRVMIRFATVFFYMAMNDGRFFSGSSARQPERKFFVDS